MNQLQLLSATVWEPLENTAFDSHPQMGESSWKSKFSAEKCQHTTEAKKKKKQSEFGHIGED